MCPNVQPGAVHGRATSWPGNGLWERTNRSTRLGEWHSSSCSYICSTVSGFAGTSRKAFSREHAHHPELATCSQCRSADTSNTMKTLGRMSTDSPFSQGLHVIISDWIASLIVPRLGPNKRVEPARSSEQLPRPNTRRCCADLDRHGLRMAIVLNCCVPNPVASREMTIGSSAAPRRLRKTKAAAYLLGRVPCAAAS